MSAPPPHEVDQLEGRAGAERRVAVWRTGTREAEAPVVLVAPGFARRMRHMAPVALYLASAGFKVYRCDYLDHVGLSDGEIYDFTMTTMYESACRRQCGRSRSARSANPSSSLRASQIAPPSDFWRRTREPPG